MDWNKFSNREGKVYYFSKPIFRTAIIILLIYFIISLFVFGIDDKVYAKCKIPGITRCENPFYMQCDALDRMRGNDESVALAKTLCNDEFLLGATTVGVPPSWFERYSNYLYFCILVFAFVLNHFLFNRPGQLRLRRTK